MIKSETELMKRAVKMLPKGVPPEAIDAVECDPYDGGENMDRPSYWVYLASGWICKEMECHTIHEDNLKNLKLMMSSIERWDDDPDLK